MTPRARGCSARTAGDTRRCAHGRPVRILGYNQEAPGGKAEVELPLAYNAPVGRWQVHVRDVASGVTADCALEVVERQD